MIEIENLQVHRDGNCICQVEKLSVAAGERLAILGTNGSGKTTLLRILAGLTDDFSGSCRVAVDCKQRTYLHQQPFLFRGSVLSNVRYGEHTGQGRGAAHKNGSTACSRPPSRTNHGDLSGGERRRAALARALAMQPQLLLLDEPLADLDDEASKIVCDVLSQLPGTTLLFASPVALPKGLAEKALRL